MKVSGEVESQVVVNVIHEFRDSAGALIPDTQTVRLPSMPVIDDDGEVRDIRRDLPGTAVEARLFH